jgi:predicted esterase
MVGLLVVLLQDPLWDYATGETSERPAVTDCTQLRKALQAHAFPAAEKTGKELSHTHKLANGHEATFYYYVPESYDPAKPTALAFFLHGAVADKTPRRGKGQWAVWKSEADKNGWIVCSPSGTLQCMWWEPSGEEHLLEAVRFLSARYNIDRNRVYLSGFSDGASGTYCLGMRLTDVWGACIPWNGAIGVIISPRAGRTPYYTLNCRGVAWRATHGSKDQLYPSSSQKPAIDQMKAAGVSVEWKNFEGIGHEGGKIISGDREFIDEWLPKQKRDPLPRQIDWITHDPQRYGQAWWIRVLALGERPADPFSKEKDFSFPVGESGPPRPVLGVQIDQQFKGPGVKIDGITEGSGAAEAGLKPGDVILSANATDLEKFEDLRGVLSKGKAGDTVKLHIKRDEQELDVEVPLKIIEAKIPPPEKAGRVRAVRDGNTVTLETRGIAKLEVLVSAEAFDLANDIVVRINGKDAFKGKVTPDAGVMLDEARRRHGDTSTLFVGRIVVDVPGEREY